MKVNSVFCDNCDDQVCVEKFDAFNWITLHYEGEEEHFCSLDCLLNITKARMHT